MLKLDHWPLNGLDSRVAGKLLLAQMYEELTGEAMPPIEKAPRGKPYFPGSNLRFSITHTKTTVFCAISDSEVGIDAEELTRKVSPSLAEKILSASSSGSMAYTRGKTFIIITAQRSAAANFLKNFFTFSSRFHQGESVPVLSRVTL